MLLVGGENLIDMFHVFGQGDDAKRADGLRLKAHLGGSPVNTAIAAGLMGAKVAYLSTISTDRFGAAFMTRLSEAKVKHLGARTDAPTSLAIVTVNEGIPSYHFYREGTAEREVEESLLRPHLDGADILHIGSLALTGERDGEEWRKLFQKAAMIGVFTSVDLNIRQRLIENEQSYRERLRRVMSDARLIKLSDEDLSWWIGDENPAHFEELCAQCEVLLETFEPLLLILTRGSEGSILWMRGEDHGEYHQCEIKAYPPSKVIDTVGAGDTFMGSFLQQYQALLESRDTKDIPTFTEVVRAGNIASIAASMNVEKEGCQPPALLDVLRRQTASLVRDK